MHARVWCLLFVLLAFVGGLLCEPTPTPTPAPTNTPARTASPTPSPTTQPPVTLRWNLGGDPGTLDPALVQSQAEMDLVTQLFLGLTAHDPQTGTPEPALATGWDVSESGQVYTFHLRADVQWVRYDPQSEQVRPLRPVTAHDVVYSLRRAVSPATQAPDAHVLDVIRNARAIRTAPDARDAETLGVTALDDYTVRFTLERPAAYLPAILALPVTHPVPPEVNAAVYHWQAPGVNLACLITNGPYVLVDCAREFLLSKIGMETGIVLRKNGHFYDADRVQIEQVECFVLDDDHVALAWYEFYEELATTHYSLESWIEDCGGKPDPVLQRELWATMRPGTFYIAFDMSRPPFDNVHVRRAFSYAVDREHLLYPLCCGYGYSARIFALPSLLGGNARTADIGVDLDVNRAWGELTLAGYSPSRDDFPAISVSGLPPPNPRIRSSLSIDKMWRESLGIRTIERRDPSDSTLPSHLEWREIVRDTVYDPVEWYTVSCTDTASMWPYLDCSDPLVARYRRLVESAAVEMDPAHRQALYREAEEILTVELCAVIPLYHDVQVWFTKSYLHRDYPVMGGQNFKDWRIDPH